jgi:multidrug efflux pump subunit AcrB
VVRENIVRHVGMGKDHHRAAREGTDEFGLAVMATTFALCAVFVPVAFMGGIVGKFFYPFGITVAVAVLVSLFVSFTLDPMLSAVWHDPPQQRMRNWWGIGHAMRATDRALDVLHAVYERLIRWVFSGRRYGFIGPRGIVVGVGVLSFVGALALAPLVGTEFVPQTDQAFTQLSLRMPTGASLERSDDKVRQVEAIVTTFPEVKTVSTQVGGSGPRRAQPGHAEHRAEGPQERSAAKAGRGRDSRPIAKIRASTSRSVSRRSTWRSSAPTQRCWRAWPPSLPSG